jgi:hypothetical protein
MMKNFDKIYREMETLLKKTVNIKNCLDFDMVSICEKLLSFDNEDEENLEQAYFYLLCVQQLIGCLRLVNEENQDSGKDSDYSMLMRKHENLIDKLDRLSKFNGQISLEVGETQLSSFLPSFQLYPRN